MEVTVHHKLAFELLDTILPRWRAEPKLYPYNRKDAVIPQRVIPKDLRKDTYALGCFYFYTCIYMRGGIESLQAFNALIRMWRAYPDLFDPIRAHVMKMEDVQTILKKFIGWDSKAAATNWVENSQRLVEDWNGNPLNLLKGLRSYDEACRRMRNKRSKRDLKAAGVRGRGFRGFQYKMVSMLIYFYDWEGWLPTRFLYPSPADFHNFRLGIAKGAIVVKTEPGETIKTSEKLSKPWREAIMAYLRARNADPVEVADALWLFSLVMCGNSPATITRKKSPIEKKSLALFVHAEVKEQWDQSEWLNGKSSLLKNSCLVCPFMNGCRPIPSRPYYTRGLIIPREPLKLTGELDPNLLNKEPTGTSPSEPHPLLF